MHVDPAQSPAPLGGIEPPARRARRMDDVLSNGHCRGLLYLVQERAGPTTLLAAAETLVERHPDASWPSSPNAEATRRLYSRLRDVTVPELEDVGLLAYDPETDVARIPDDVVVAVTPPWRSAQPGQPAADARPRDRGPQDVPADR